VPPKRSARRPNSRKKAVAAPSLFDWQGFNPVPPRPPSPATRLVLAHDSRAAEELRLLVSRIQELHAQRPLRCIGLVSAAGGEGKTTVGLGLARALAHSGECKVLFLECDLRRPAVERYLGLPRAPGLSEYLQDETVAAVRPRLVDPPGFALVASGQRPLARPEVLGSLRMRALLESARREFDYVIADCPPVNPVTDAVMLQDIVDGFLFVVRARTSPVEAIQHAVTRLKRDRIRGVVFNDQKEIIPRYYTYGYKYYGEDEGRK
jgi:capsular exopolysaccharide synthesis family protein